jgi:hypothetical protein
MAGHGVFLLVCPDCGESLLPDDGEVVCASCHRQFLARVGHLIPVDAGWKASAPTSGEGELG